MKKQRAKRANGFTLVEAIVAGIISVIIAAIGITVFIMYNRQLRESMAMAKLQRQYENIAEQIGHNVRTANRVLKTGDDLVNPPTPLDTAGCNDVKTIALYDKDLTQIAGYSVSTGTFREWKNGGLEDYVAGGGVVYVDIDESRFVLTALRDEVEVYLRLIDVGKVTTYLQPRKDAFKCRNQTLY